MDFKTGVFYFLSSILIFASLRVITARNPVHAALHLVLCFFTAGGIWALLQAEFLAIALVMVYVGAVMVLFLFVVMMLDINMDRIREGFWKYLPLGTVVGVLMVLEMGVVLGGHYFQVLDSDVPNLAANASNTKELGVLLFTDYVYPFELASVILLVALIAAVAITYRGRKKSSYVDPSDQVRVRASDRMRIVQMPVEVQE